MLIKAIFVVTMFLVSVYAHAQIRCVPSGGGTCCWDINKDGPWKPIGC